MQYEFIHLIVKNLLNTILKISFFFLPYWLPGCIKHSMQQIKSAPLMPELAISIYYLFLLLTSNKISLNYLYFKKIVFSSQE